MTIAELPVAPDPALVLDEIERLHGFGCVVWYPDTGAAFWSDGLYRLLGLPPRVGGEPAPPSHVQIFYGRIHPDDRERVRAAQARLVTEGVVVDIPYRIQRPDGTEVRVRGRATAARRADGGVTRLMGALFDVTQATLTENRLAEVDALLVETQLVAGVGTHVFDIATGRLDWSPTLYDILGVDPSLVPTGELSAEITHPDDRPLQLEWGMSLMRGEIVGPVVTRIVHPDGTLRYIESRGRRVDSEAGARIVGVTIDVTARVELEERLRQVAKMEAVGTLAAGVAHDFNNYLTVMALEVDAISRDVSSPRVEGLRNAIGQCASLTAQLRAFARKHPKASASVDLGALVETSVGLFERAAAPAVTVETRLGSARVAVTGDAAQLGNALMNLLLNARDAMPTGGRITVSVDERELEAHDPLLDPGAVAGRYARLTVADEGAGIAPEDQARIFEPYFSTKAPGRGTGLGLASVYGIVKQHGGIVRVQSARGAGSRFEIYLPGATRVLEEHAADARPAGLSGTVLVVEDTAPLRAVLCSILQDAGLTVHVADSGRQALEVLGRVGEVDMVLTDVVMPGIDGCALANEVLRRAPTTRVVFMSAYVDAGLQARIERDAPGRLLLHKPFDRDDLLQALSTAMTDGAASDVGG